MEVDLVSVNDSCRAGEEHSGDSRQTSERMACKASLQLEVEEDCSPPSSPGWPLLDLCPTRNPYRTAVQRRPLKLTTRSVIQPIQQLWPAAWRMLFLLRFRRDKWGWWKHHSYWCFWGGGSGASGDALIISSMILYEEHHGLLALCPSLECCHCIGLKSKEMCSCWVWSGLAGLIWASVLVRLAC